MKKLKEFFIFPLIMILLIAVFLGIFIILKPDGTYYDDFEYIKIMVTNSYFLPAMVITFSIPFLISIVTSFITTFVMLFLKFKKNMSVTRAKYYYTNALLSVVVSFAYFAIFTNALQKTDQLNVSLQMTIFAILFAVMVALLIIFTIWLIEFITSLIIKIIKRSKS